MPCICSLIFGRLLGVKPKSNPADLRAFVLALGPIDPSGRMILPSASRGYGARPRLFLTDPSKKLEPPSALAWLPSVPLPDWSLSPVTPSFLDRSEERR